MVHIFGVLIVMSQKQEYSNRTVCPSIRQSGKIFSSSPKRLRDFIETSLFVTKPS
jgi:hypothetical protein